MSSVSLLGHFETNDEVFFEVNNSSRSNNEALNQIKNKLFENDIDSLTIEYDDNTFTHFLKTDNGKIRFIEGNNSEIAVLQSKLKNGLEGEVLDDENAPEPIKKPEVKSTLTATRSHEGQSDHARIHSSFLQGIANFKTAYSDAEIYFQPYEEPGGDFFWTKDYQYRNLIVVGDCTGHGMQGAMIGMSVMTLLKQFFRLPPTDLKEAMYEFHRQMHELLEEEHESFDAELGFILIDKRKNKLDFVGSGIDLLIRTEKGMEACRTRKRSLVQNKLEQFTFQVESGDQLFAYTDGIIDQFDKDNSKKFKSTGIADLIEVLPKENTLDAFSEKFEEFRGDTEQLDDQTMIVLTV